LDSRLALGQNEVTLRPTMQPVPWSWCLRACRVSGTAISWPCRSPPKS